MKRRRSAIGQEVICRLRLSGRRPRVGTRSQSIQTCIRGAIVGPQRSATTTTTITRHGAAMRQFRQARWAATLPAQVPMAVRTWPVTYWSGAATGISAIIIPRALQSTHRGLTVDPVVFCGEAVGIPAPDPVGALTGTATWANRAALASLTVSAWLASRHRIKSPRAWCIGNFIPDTPNQL